MTVFSLCVCPPRLSLLRFSALQRWALFTLLLLGCCGWLLARYFVFPDFFLLALDTASSSSASRLRGAQRLQGLGCWSCLGFPNLEPVCFVVRFVLFLFCSVLAAAGVCEPSSGYTR